MGFAIIFIILAMLAYILHKMSFATRIKIAIVFLILLGIHHSYVAITSVEDDDITEVITDYVEKCNNIYDAQLAKNIAITIFSEAAANACIEPVNEFQSRLHSHYLIGMGQGGISDVFNYFPAYIAENYLGYDSEEGIEQIGRKAGISAVEEAECRQPKTNNTVPTKEENINNIEIENLKSEEKNTTLPVESEEKIEANSGFSYSEEWKNIKNAIQNDPEKFLLKCIETEINIAKEFGGMTREDALSSGIKESCKKELFDFKSCMAMSLSEGEHCYIDLVKDRDI